MTYIDFNDVIFCNLYIGKGSDSKTFFLQRFSGHPQAAATPPEHLHAHGLPENAQAFLQGHAYRAAPGPSRRYAKS